MGYRVIRFFTDLKDNNHPYQVGDSFPRLGMEVSAKRINELATSENRQRRPLIEFVDDKKSEVKREEIVAKEETAKEGLFTKTEINRMPLNELKALASANGIEGWKDMTGAELKKKLIKKFNL